jgi:hypothetical protein
MPDGKTDTTREEPPEPPTDINELCGQARLASAYMAGLGNNPGVHPTVAYSCRSAAKFITSLTDAIRRVQKGQPL